jgi:hypothetical protein
MVSGIVEDCHDTVNGVAGALRKLERENLLSVDIGFA